MTVIVNGEPRELPDGTTVSQLIARLGLEGRPIAVERNRDIVPKATYGQTRLQEGDRLEIVTFVGGG